MADFPERLQELIEGCGMSRTAVAEETGITMRALQHYAKLERKPTMDSLIALADFFNVSIDYLVGRTDNSEIIR